MILLDIGESYAQIKLIQGFMIQSMAAGFPAVHQFQLCDLCPSHHSRQTQIGGVGIYKVRASIAKLLHDGEGILIGGEMLVIEGKNDDGGGSFRFAEELTAWKQQRNPQENQAQAPRYDAGFEHRNVNIHKRVR